MDLVTVEGVIDPVVARFVERVVADGARRHVEAVVVLLDTPGGLDVSMRQIVQSILGSAVPVVVFVAPSGARAGSAGVFLTMAAHVAAMAPGTNVGAAHPVAFGGAPIPEAQEEKIVNDAAAYIRSLASRQGRNADWAEKAVRQSVSVTDREALRLKVIDLVARDVDELLVRLDGRKVATARGEIVLRTRDAERRDVKMSAPERLLHALVDPNIAYLLLILGLWALVAEFSHPGAILPGVAGVLSLILALVAFGSLPVNWAGVALLVLAIVLFLLDIKVTGFGLTVGGVVAFVLGTLMLYRPFKPAPPAMPRLAVDLRLMGVLLLGLLAFFLFVVSKAIQAQRVPVDRGMRSLVGARGRAITALAPGGTVLVRGEEWSAEAEQGPIPAGEDVTVVGSKGLTLRVVATSKPSEGSP
ncbi:MAG: nodulation protein NfeD [Gemmatimonadetes bacterium]|nr:nodulation protein NfeD [Gemmatimonadota bacterium]